MRTRPPTAPSGLFLRARYAALNAGAHGEYNGSAVAIHERTRDLVVGLMQTA